MNYNTRRPKINEIVIVPLSHPNGAYIRLDGGERVPVLAKVRTIFSEQANVINYFGYSYNVPISHIQFISNTASALYVDMIERAKQLMDQLGYKILDNSEFYDTTYSTVQYNLLSHLPGYDSIVISTQSPIMDHKLVPTSTTITPLTSASLVPVSSSSRISSKTGRKSRRDNIEDIDDDSNGNIRVVVGHQRYMVHVINKTRYDLIFDKGSNELSIRGYGRFVIDESYTYKRRDSSTKYIIFRSKNQFIHVKESNVTYSRIPKARDDDGNYTVKLLKLKSSTVSNPKIKSYHDLIGIIDREFFK